MLNILANILSYFSKSTASEDVKAPLGKAYYDDKIYSYNQIIAEANSALDHLVLRGDISNEEYKVFGVELDFIEACIPCNPYPVLYFEEREANIAEFLKHEDYFMFRITQFICDIERLIG